MLWHLNRKPHAAGLFFRFKTPILVPGANLLIYWTESDSKDEWHREGRYNLSEKIVLKITFSCQYYLRIIIAY